MNEYLWYALAVMALVTASLRFLPFVLFSKGKTPRIMVKLGKVLPYAVMGMLVIYCLKDIQFSEPVNYLPPLCGCAVVAATYLWKRNTLLSIIAGTLCNMLLLQLAF